MSELLDIDDPLLPRLREAALRNEEAHQWLLDSARRWARGEFLRRDESRGGRTPERYGLDGFRPSIEQEIERLKRHQVAVLVGDYLADSSIPVQADRIFTGFLRDECGPGYLCMWLAGGRAEAGLQDIFDLFELPEAWRTKTWPLMRSRSDTTPATDGVTRSLRRDVPLRYKGYTIWELGAVRDPMRNAYTFPPGNVLSDEVLRLAAAEIADGGMPGPVFAEVERVLDAAMTALEQEGRLGNPGFAATAPRTLVSGDSITITERITLS